VGHVPALVSLGITLGVLAAGIIFSMLKTRGEPDTESMSQKIDHKK
jgi:hydrogenase-4 membrane subunit HyfE